MFCFTLHCTVYCSYLFPYITDHQSTTELYCICTHVWYAQSCRYCTVITHASCYPYPSLVPSPRTSQQQMDYITATLAHWVWLIDVCSSATRLCVASIGMQARCDVASSILLNNADYSRGPDSVDYCCVSEDQR